MHTSPYRSLPSFASAVGVRFSWSRGLGARAQRALVRWAFRDDLTGVLNRRGFRLAAARRLSVARRRGRPLLVFFADLDGFKRINDTFGHREGDRALVRTASAFRKTFRKTDVIARFGGDEFVALVTDESACSADALCRRLQQNLAHAADEESRYCLSLSVGVVRHGPDGLPSLHALIAAADEQLYARKHKRLPSVFFAERRRRLRGPLR